MEIIEVNQTMDKFLKRVIQPDGILIISSSGVAKRWKFVCGKPKYNADHHISPINAGIY